MDNDTSDLLRELITLQKEQNTLLKRYLWRLRFSLLTLLLITTATAVTLGIVATRMNSGTRRAFNQALTNPLYPVVPYVPNQVAPVPPAMPLPSPNQPPQSGSKGVTIMPLRQ
jgi:hypothetical protein